MSKDKAEEKAIKYALKQLKYHIDRGDKELTYSTEACVNIAAKDYATGYTQAITDLSTENAQLREALRELVDQIDEIGVNRAVDYANGSRYYRCMISDESYAKAKKLLTDKE